MFKDIFTNERVHSEAGSRFAPTYGVVFKENGVRTLEVKGQKDIYAEIQSHKDACDIHTIMDRFQQTGDTTLLSRRPAFFADLSNMPDTPAEWFQLQADAKAYFDKLPVDIKAEFNNSTEQFIAAIGTKDFDEIIKRHVPYAFTDDKKPEVKPEVKEVVENEQK